MKKYFYLTQYDECGMFNEDIMEILEKNNQEAEGESLEQLLEIIPEVADRYNQELYNVMMSGSLNDVDVILEALEKYAKDDGMFADQALNDVEVAYEE